VKRVLILIVLAIGVTATSSSSRALVGSRTTAIFAAPYWSLSAWRSQGSLCISYQALGSYGQGCHIDVTRPLGLLIAHLGQNEQIIFGIAKPGVVRLVLRLPDGKQINARVRSAPPSLRTPVRFFEIHSQQHLAPQTAPRHSPLGVIEGYAQSGRVLGRIKL